MTRVGILWRKTALAIRNREAVLQKFQNFLFEQAQPARFWRRGYCPKREENSREKIRLQLQEKTKEVTDLLDQLSPYCPVELPWSKRSYRFVLSLVTKTKKKPIYICQLGRRCRKMKSKCFTTSSITCDRKSLKAIHFLLSKHKIKTVEFSFYFISKPLMLQGIVFVSPRVSISTMWWFFFVGRQNIFV